MKMLAVTLPRRLRSRARRDRAGYSLLEILIVVAIIALLAALVGPRIMAQLDRSKVRTAEVQARALVSALHTMRLDIGRYPTEDEGLTLLVENPSGAVTGWYGPYLDGGVPADPWGRPYVYETPATPEGNPAVISLGSDGQPGGTGLAQDVRPAGSAPAAADEAGAGE